MGFCYEFYMCETGKTQEFCVWFPSTISDGKICSEISFLQKIIEAAFRKQKMDETDRARLIMLEIEKTGKGMSSIGGINSFDLKTDIGFKLTKLGDKILTDGQKIRTAEFENCPYITSPQFPHPYEPLCMSDAFDENNDHIYEVNITFRNVIIKNVVCSNMQTAESADKRCKSEIKLWVPFTAEGQTVCDIGLPFYELDLLADLAENTQGTLVLPTIAGKEMKCFFT